MNTFTQYMQSRFLPKGQFEEASARLEGYVSLYDNFSGFSPANQLFETSREFINQYTICIYVMKGQAELKVDNDHHVLMTRTLNYVASHSVVQALSASEDFHFFLYAISNEAMQDVYKNGKDITRNVKDIQADKTSFVITTGMKAGTEDVYTVNYQVNTKKVDEEYLDNTACASADNAGQVKDSLRLPQKSEDRTDGGGERSDGNGSDNGGAAASSPVKTGDLFSTSVIILFILSAGLMAAAFLLKKKEKDR